MLDSYLYENPTSWIPHPCNEIDPTADPDASSMANYERVVGSAVMRGEIDAREAYKALCDYKAWQLAGEPKGEYGTL